MCRKSLGLTATMFLAAAFAGRVGYGQVAYYGGVSPYYGYGPYGHHASTAGEGYARGMADVIRSYGENHLANARAQVAREAAREEYIENRLRATEAFYERRAMYDEYRAAKQYEAREKANAWLATIRLEEFSPQEFDVNTGQIGWPKLLTEAPYQEFRKPLGALFAKRAQYGELEVEDFAQAQALIKQWRTVLTNDRDDIPEVMLRDGLRFLLRLNRELEHNFG